VNHPASRPVSLHGIVRSENPPLAGLSSSPGSSSSETGDRSTVGPHPRRPRIKNVSAESCPGNRHAQDGEAMLVARQGPTNPLDGRWIGQGPSGR
jgi:hypothetical protein